MPELGILKNLTNVMQSWGNYEIAPRSVGCVPLPVAEGLRARPSREFQVLDADADLVFHSTDRKPFSPRWKR